MRTAILAVSSAALSLPLTAVAATASAPTIGGYYRSCDDLHKDFKYGVAKSAVAARKQVRDGLRRPAYGPPAVRTYNLNSSRLDRDRDGTACESD